MSTRSVLAATAAVAVLAGSASPAAGASRASCEAQSGRTLAANSQARLYLTRKPSVLAGRPAKRRPGIYLCGFTRKTSAPKMLFEGTDRPDGYGLNGGYAWARYIENAVNTPDADLQEIVYMTGVNRDRVLVAGVTGVTLSDIVVSRTGVVAALATPQKLPKYTQSDPGQSEIVPARSSIVAADPDQRTSYGVAPFRTIASAEPGTFTHLAATPDSSTLLWSRTDGQVGTAPFAVPANAPEQS